MKPIIIEEPVLKNEKKIIYNSIPEQHLTHANELTLYNWNDYINQLRKQTNNASELLEHCVENTSTIIKVDSLPIPVVDNQLYLLLNDTQTFKKGDIVYSVKQEYNLMIPGYTLYRNLKSTVAGKLDKDYSKLIPKDAIADTDVMLILGAGDSTPRKITGANLKASLGITISDHFKGDFLNEEALFKTTGVAGDFAYVNQIGSAPILYIWDSNDNHWVRTGASQFVSQAEYNEYVASNNAIVATKLSTVREQEKVYATDSLGNQTTLQYNTEAYGGGLARRTNDGQLKIKDAKNTDEAVSLGQLNAVDPQIVTNPKLTGDETKLTGLEIKGTKYKLPEGGKIEQASETTLGGIHAAPKLPTDDKEVKIDPSTGKLYTSGLTTIPIASASKLGGIKVGKNLSIDSVTGVLSANDSGNTVVANPNEVSTEYLNSLKVDNVVYDNPIVDLGIKNTVIPNAPVAKSFIINQQEYNIGDPTSYNTASQSTTTLENIKVGNSVYGLPILNIKVSDTVQPSSTFARTLTIGGDNYIFLVAGPKSSEDTQEVHMGTDGKLYTKPGGGISYREIK